MLKYEFSGKLAKKSFKASIASDIHGPLIEPDLSTKKINSPAAIYSSSSESVFFTSSVASGYELGMKLIIAATSSGYFSLSLNRI